MKNNKYCLLTNDVETTSIWHNSLRDETGKKVLNEGLPLLLDIYNKYNIKTTFFVTGYIARLYPKIIKLIVENGHELGSHGLSHEKQYGFDIMDYNTQMKHLSKSKEILENISGKEVISFRSPALRVQKNTAKALLETGYIIDSSVASQRFDMFMSFGSLKKLNWLFCPRLPYKSKIDNIFKKGNNGIIEIPLSATLFPYLGTTMRIFPGLTNIQRKLLAFESNINGKPIVFDIHPNEFLNENNEKRFIQKRSNNFLSYLLKDYLRSRLKIKNLGLKAVSLYEEEINYFIRDKYNFDTIKNFCTYKNLF